MPSIVIQEVYGGGGSAVPTYSSDYVVLLNISSVDVSLAGMALQYSAASGTTWQVGALSGTIAAGGYFLVSMSTGINGSPLIPADLTLASSIPMGNASGKIALTSTTTALSGSAPTDSTIVDLVGYGAASTSETSPTPLLSPVSSASRDETGGWDTDNNLLDLIVGAPNPHNSTSVHWAGLFTANADTVTLIDKGVTWDALAGDDVVNGTTGADTVFGSVGHDTLNGDDGADTLIGNNDIFAQESDTLNGGGGNDILLGEFTDTIDGGAGIDSLYAVNAFNWTIDLTATSIEWFSAGFGDDHIDASMQVAAVTIYANGGNDNVLGGSFADTIWLGDGDDSCNGFDGDDVIVGEGGSDTYSGGGGNDQMYVEAADSNVNGGSGTDAVFITAGAGMTIDMGFSQVEWVGDYAGGNDTITAATTIGVDAVVYGGSGRDIVTGGAGADFLWGEAGIDTISGGANADTLVGGLGRDDINGGTGNDNIFCNSGGGGDGVRDDVIYDALGWGTDFVYDFEHNIDKINMQGTGATAGTITIQNLGGHADVHFGIDRIIVVNAGATLTTADFIF